MKQIELSDRVIGVVDVDRELYSFERIVDNILFIDYTEVAEDNYHLQVRSDEFLLPKKDWKLIGRVSEIMDREEKCKEVVEADMDIYPKCYKDYVTGEYTSPIFTESFRSFITAHSLNETHLLIVKMK